MINNSKKLLMLLAFLFIAGCASVSEPFKFVMGTSTKALEEARENAMSANYECTLSQCFDAALALGVNYSKGVPINKKYYYIFQKSRKKGMIVVMEIPGQVNTTEVGIFFHSLDEKKTMIEITSLSSSAKKKVADELFAELGHHFIKEN